MVGAAETNGRQLGDASWNGPAVWPEHRRRRCRPRHEDGEARDQSSQEGGPDRTASPFLSRLAAARQSDASDDAEGHGKADEKSVDTSRQDELDDPVRVVEADVERRTNDAEAGELDADDREQPERE